MSALTLERPTAAITTPDDNLEHFFLGRLATLVAQQAAAASPSERLTLARAAFAVLLDCVDLGFGEQAQALLDQRHDAPLPPAWSAA